MKKTIVILFLGICLCLLYVKEQVELVHISYQIRNKEKQVEELIFLNRALEYELAVLKSPVVLEKRFAAVNSKQAYLTSWKVAGIIKTSQPKGYNESKVLAAARSQKNIWQNMFGGLVPEAIAQGTQGTK